MSYSSLYPPSDFSGLPFWCELISKNMKYLLSLVLEQKLATMTRKFDSENYIKQ